GSIQIWRSAEARLLPEIAAETLSMLDSTRGQLIDGRPHARVWSSYRKILSATGIAIPVLISGIRDPSLWISTIGFDCLAQHKTRYGIDIARAPWMQPKIGLQLFDLDGSPRRLPSKHNRDVLLTHGAAARRNPGERRPWPRHTSHRWPSHRRVGCSDLRN